MNLLDMPQPPPVRGARVISNGMTIVKGKPKRQASELFSDDEVRRIRFLRHRCKVWVAALDAKYQDGYCDPEIYAKKVALRARIMDAFGTAPLGVEYGVSGETISKIARRVIYAGVK